MLIVTYDEDDFTTTNKIATVFYGANVVQGSYSQTINHYNVLRTIEDAFRSASHAGAAASATPIGFCWNSIVARPANIATSTDVNNNVTVYPNPATSQITFNLEKLPSSPVLIKIFDMTGRLEREYQLKTKNLQVNTSSFPAGNYYYKMMQNNYLLRTGIFIVGGKSVKVE